MIKLSTVATVVGFEENRNMKKYTELGIGKLPYGAKRGFIERKDLLKERLYQRRKKVCQNLEI